jgi:UrcA family protein
MLFGSFGSIEMKPRTAMGAMALGLAVVSAPLFAEEQEIIVQSPRVEVARSGSYVGARPVDVITVSHIVSYSNIDISTSSGAQVLKQRIADAAKAACKEIDVAYPTRQPVTGEPACEKAATDAAMVQANAAIAAAEKARRK